MRKLALPTATALLLLAACATPLEPATIDSITPSSAELGTETRVTLSGTGLYSLSDAGDPLMDGIGIQVCGVNLTDLELGSFSSQSIPQVPGRVSTVLVSSSVSGTIGGDATAGVSDVVVTLPLGGTAVLEDGFECVAPAPDPDPDPQPDPDPDPQPDPQPDPDPDPDPDPQPDPDPDPQPDPQPDPDPDPDPEPTITIRPAEPAVHIGDTLQLTAVLENLADESVVWTLDGPGSLDDATANPVSYTAPAEPGTATLTAASVSEPGLSAQVEIEIRPLPTIEIVEGARLLFTGQSARYTAVVKHLDYPQVRWMVSAGEMTEVTDNSVTLTAPPVDGTLTLEAHSIFRPDLRASITIDVAELTVELSPTQLTLVPGDTAHFTAVIDSEPTGIAEGVAWTVDPMPAQGYDQAGDGNNALEFEVTEADIGTFSITAVSNAYPVRSASATLVVQPGSLTVSPGAATVSPSGSITLNAQGTGGTLTWSSTDGSLSASTGSSVTLTAPPYGGGTVTVTVSDGALSATAHSEVRTQQAARFDATTNFLPYDLAVDPVAERYYLTGSQSRPNSAGTEETSVQLHEWFEDAYTNGSATVVGGGHAGAVLSDGTLLVVGTTDSTAVCNNFGGNPGVALAPLAFRGSDQYRLSALYGESTAENCVPMPEDFYGGVVDVASNGNDEVFALYSDRFRADGSSGDWDWFGLLRYDAAAPDGERSQLVDTGAVAVPNLPIRDTRSFMPTRLFIQPDQGGGYPVRVHIAGNAMDSFGALSAVILEAEIGADLTLHITDMFKSTDDLISVNLADLSVGPNGELVHVRNQTTVENGRRMVLSWLGMPGSGSYDFGPAGVYGIQAVTTDEDGNIYAAGQALTSDGNSEAFIAKLNDEGTLQWREHFAADGLGQTFVTRIRLLEDGQLAVGGFAAPQTGYGNLQFDGDEVDSWVMILDR